MSSEEFEKLLKLARKSLTPMQRRRLAQELAQAESPTHDQASPQSVLDALLDLGVIGSITDGPGDLSTNPKHMEGFGKHA